MVYSPFFKIDRTGCTRIVILIGNFAIKIPAFDCEWRLFLRGLLANMQEARWAKTGWDELCPVKFSIPGGFFLIMKRARELTDNEFLALNLKEFIHDDCIIPVELKSNSFGYIDGKLVAIDYGN